MKPTPAGLIPLIRWDMKPVEKAICQAAYERWPHPSHDHGQASHYFVTSPLPGADRLVFRRIPGTGGILDWHHLPGLGQMPVLIRSIEQLQRIVEGEKGSSTHPPQELEEKEAESH